MAIHVAQRKQQFINPHSYEKTDILLPPPFSCDAEKFARSHYDSLWEKADV